ncbi:MAG TPA: DUF4270 family protein [Chryseosolibacter sp.]
MKKKIVLFKTVALSAVATLLCNCSETSTIGSEFFSDNRFNVAVIDTVSVRSYTVLADSFVTSNAPRMLVGTSKSDNLGVLSAKTFLQLFPATSVADSIYLERTRVTYLGTQLILRYDNYSYNDTTVENTIRVHRVTERIDENDDGSLYNTSKFAFNQIPIGQLNFKPRPHADSLAIPIDDAVGSSLIDLSFAESDILTDEKKFEQFFHGIVITLEGGQPGTVLGFSPNPELRVYYKDKANDADADTYLSFKVKSRSNAGIYFNQVLADRTMTKLRNLTRNLPIESTITNNEVYLQGGAGLVSLIEVPHLQLLTTNNPDLIITEASLVVKPILKGAAMNTDFPAELAIAGVDRKLTRTYTFKSGLVLYEDPYLGRDVFYHADVTAYVQAQLGKTTEERNRILISLTQSDQRQTVSTVRLDSEIMLLVKYITVNEY